MFTNEIYHTATLFALIAVLSFLGCDKMGKEFPTEAPVDDQNQVLEKSTSRPVHSVVGHGLVDMRNDPDWLIPVVFTATVSAHKNADDHVWGTFAGSVLLRFDDPAPWRYSGKVTCLDVEEDGKAAWVYAKITESTNQELAPIGETILLFVHDLGKEGADFMHTEFTKDIGNPTCGETFEPLRDITPVDRGNYHVR